MERASVSLSIRAILLYKHNLLVSGSVKDSFIISLKCHFTLHLSI